MPAKTQGLGFVFEQGNGGPTRELRHQSDLEGLILQRQCSDNANTAYLGSLTGKQGNDYKALVSLGQVCPLSKQLGKTNACACAEDMQCLLISFALAFPSFGPLSSSASLSEEKRKERKCSSHAWIAAVPPCFTSVAAPYGTLDCLHKSVYQ
ncbi:hypothetical protein mRhiFer1_007833 [Rhinolophus ferrumequinum]|uniref:Uncharacterized protein n=1 Tax=Rhinolophus ferrumequinum TaxID=59479 RepID=A0A7J8AUM3_RHIFE|nr:hypothetical protein mRhiFer1_007833 [Rhinolophus ferrumequinum]